jgi:hypothetical protein
MNKIKKASGPSTKRARSQELRQRLKTKALSVQELTENMPERMPEKIADMITRKHAWIGSYATGKFYGQKIPNSLDVLSTIPSLELAPTKSILGAFDFHREAEVIRRLVIISQDSGSPTPYKVGKFALREDDWSVLLVAIPTPDTASRIHRKQNAIELLLGSPPIEEHEELIIGSFGDMSTAEVVHETMAVQNKTAGEPMLMLGASSLRGIYL